MTDTIWTFQTGRFTVALEIEPEHSDPAEFLFFDEDIEAVRNGTYDAFIASVVVYLDGREVGRDTLGGCVGNAGTFSAEHRDHDPMNRNCSIMRAAHGNIAICHYFPDMVRNAIAEARSTLTNAPYLRAA